VAHLQASAEDFAAAAKIQQEDDISASVVVPREKLAFLARPQRGKSSKVVINCEYRWCPRPDDAVHRGLDKQTEMDMPGRIIFISNFEPIPPKRRRRWSRGVDAVRSIHRADAENF